MTKHALYATARDSAGEREHFRIGQPTDFLTAQRRWLRLDDRRLLNRRPVVRANRRQYVVEFFEVRAVDRHGRGLGSERHTLAHPVPFRAAKITR